MITLCIILTVLLTIALIVIAIYVSIVKRSMKEAFEGLHLLLKEAGVDEVIMDAAFSSRLHKIVMQRIAEQDELSETKRMLRRVEQRKQSALFQVRRIICEVQNLDSYETGLILDELRNLRSEIININQTDKTKEQL